MIDGAESMLLILSWFCLVGLCSFWLSWGILILALVAPDVLEGVMQQVVCDEGE